MDLGAFAQIEDLEKKTDDAFDNTYCDIYAKIKPIENASSHSEQSL